MTKVEFLVDLIKFRSMALGRQIEALLPHYPDESFDPPTAPEKDTEEPRPIDVDYVTTILREQICLLRDAKSGISGGFHQVALTKISAVDAGLNGLIQQLESEQGEINA